MNQSQNKKMRVVFLGTPAIVVPVLEILLAENTRFEVVAVVSQPPTRAPRGQQTIPSPVHQKAIDSSIPVLTPDDAKASSFIQELKEMQPDLCVTAAYGQVLSEEFLAIPAFGTLNIHPSLLPLYRGAAPVQRALENGVKVSGVTIAKTVRAMDAGPVVAQVQYQIDSAIKAPQLLAELFKIGAEKLVNILPDYFAGRVVPLEQKHEMATKARKIQVEESVLRPGEQSASTLHNKVRAFSGWPGTRLNLFFGGAVSEVKVLTTRVSPHSKAKNKDIIFNGEALELVCVDGSVLEILDLQAPGKRAVSARDFWNGLKTKDLRWV
ncbi:MAG: methionyl-tRNA formyltransferase [Silvanigrellaceae bacterium]